MATTLEYRSVSLSFPKEIKEIQTPEVRLEPLKYSQETLDLWFKWMNDPDLRKYMSLSLTNDKEHIREWLELASMGESRHYFTIMTEGLPAQAGKTSAL